MSARQNYRPKVGHRQRQPDCADEDCHLDREIKMARLADGVFCDPCIAPLVAALNAAGIHTVASCCGHGFRPGWIALRDGRQLTVCRSLDEQHRVDALFTTDINGDPYPPDDLGPPKDLG
jgi:hypothetical protein